MAENDDGDGKRPDDYVGYGHPPKQHQFKKGNNANPNGRKGKPRRRDFLDERQRVEVEGQWRWLSRNDLVERALYKAAIKGNVSAVTKLEARYAKRQAARQDDGAAEEERRAAEFIARQLKQRRPPASTSDDEEPDGTAS